MGGANSKLRQWRTARNLTMEEAAERVVVDGQPCSKVTWHGWEAQGKIPKLPYMIAVCELTGLEPNDFYPRPDGGTNRATGNGGANGGSAPKSGMTGGGEPPQLAMAL